MKKAIAIVMTTILVGGLGVGGYYMYNKYNMANPYTMNVTIDKDEEGKVVTKREWYFKPNETGNVLVYSPEYLLTSKTTVHKLNLFDNKYVDLVVPDIKIMLDSCKTICAIDGSFKIEIYKGINESNVTSIVPKYTSVTQNDLGLYVFNEGNKGVVHLVNIIEDNAILCSIYNSDEYYTVLYNTMSNLRAYSIEEVPTVEEVRELDSLKYIGRYKPSVTFENVVLEQKKYLFENGGLWIYSELVNITEAIEPYKAKTYALSCSPIDTEHKSDFCYYAQFGNWHLCLIKYNANTTITLIGEGEEAKCNIVSIVSNLQQQ